MYVIIGNYPSLYGHHFLRWLFNCHFISEQRFKKWNEWYNTTWLYKWDSSAYFRRERTMKILVHDYDLYNADITLSFVILNVLKKYKQQSDLFGSVSDDDVPDHLKTKGYQNRQEKDKWDWAIDEMIFAFESISADDTKVTTNQDDRIQNGLNLFSKYFRSLWD